MIIPPLQRAIISNTGDKKNQVDHVWYGFFRNLYETLFGAIGDAANSANSLLGQKLNASASGGSAGWEDLRFPATTISIGGGLADPAFNSTYIGYNFINGAEKQLAIIAQMSHGWNRGNVHPHVHWKPLTNSAGNTLFKLDYSWTPSLGHQPVFTTAYTNGVVSLANNAVLKEHITSLGNIVPPAGANESSILKIIFSRAGLDVRDTYAATIMVDELDIHYQHEKAGTPQEYPS